MISVIGVRKRVHEMGQGLRVHALGAAREAADVAEHDRHHPHLAAELELFGVRGQLFDVMRRHVAREGAADFALARLGAQIAEQARHQIDEGDHRPGVDRVEQQMRVFEGDPRAAERDRDRGAAEGGARQRADPRHTKISPAPTSERKQDFGADRPIGPGQKVALQDLVDQLGVDLDPGHGAATAGSPGGR